MSRWKGVSGKNVAASDIQQGKPVVSHGKGRRKSGPSQQLTSERVVVENNSLSGDRAREAAKQTAESLKNQVREKLGEGTTSAIANAIINGLADTGDAALGSADYAADAAMALASCAAGDSYCSKAMSDLAGRIRRWRIPLLP